MKKYFFLFVCTLMVFNMNLWAQRGKNKDTEEEERPTRKELEEQREAEEMEKLNAIKLYPDERKGYWGYVNEQGRRQIDYEFDWAGDFSEGLAPVERNYKYGYIDKRGDYVIRPRYEDAAPFSEGLAAVVYDSKYGFINKEGEEVIECKYDDAESFHDGLALVTLDDKDGYIDTEGNLLSDTWYDEVGPFFRGICKVVKDGKVQYMNQKGRIVEVDPMSCFDKVLKRAEVMPKFKGGIDAMHEFFQEHIKYPYKAGENRIEGTVFLRVEIRKDGKVSNVELVSGLGYGCDEEAIRVVNLLPPFEPAMQGGQPVCVTTVITVDFGLDLFYKQQASKN